MNNTPNTLFPFVMAGVILAFFLPAGGPPASRRFRPQPSFNGSNNDGNLPPPYPGRPSDVGPSNPITNGMVNLRDTVRAFCALSTTSRIRSESSTRASRASTIPVDPRATLWSAALAQGWGGLDGISNEALALLGSLRGFNARGRVSQDERVYLTQFVSYVLMSVLLCHQESLITTGVLQGLAADFARTGRLDFSTISSAAALVFGNNNALVDLITAATNATVDLAVILVREVDENPEVREAFQMFAQNPASWSGYLSNVEAIIQFIHHPRGPSHRNLTVIPPLSQAGPSTAAPSLTSTFVEFFNTQILGRARGDGPGHGIDIEAGLRNFILHDRDIEYLAALFVAALMRFHAGSGSNGTLARF